MESNSVITIRRGLYSSCLLFGKAVGKTAAAGGLERKRQIFAIRRGVHGLYGDECSLFDSRSPLRQRHDAVRRNYHYVLVRDASRLGRLCVIRRENILSGIVIFLRRLKRPKLSLGCRCICCRGEHAAKAEYCKQYTEYLFE